MSQRGQGESAQATHRRGKHAKSSHEPPSPPRVDADNAPTARLPVVAPALAIDDHPEAGGAEAGSVQAGGVANGRSVPEAAVARLAVYLRVLSGLAEQNVRTVSSEELAEAVGVNSAKLRKDLSYLGSYGTRGVGYDIAVLIDQIERAMGLNHDHKVAVVGIGNLGHALANYGGFPGRGFPVEALFDSDPDLIGIAVGGLPVSHVDDIPSVCARRQISVGVIATPPMAAQSVCDRLVAGGVQCILNFAPVILRVPPQVEVRKVDLAVELQILSFHVAQRSASRSGQPISDVPVSDVLASAVPANSVPERSVPARSVPARDTISSPVAPMRGKA